MNDSKDKPDDEPMSDKPDGPLGGERLAEARRTLKISVIEIAKELHLDEPKVHALERNDFDILGAPVFAKGHLRKYAKLLNIDEGDVMADYYQLTRAAGAPPPLTTRRRARWEMSPGPWIGVIIVVVLVATAYWWFASQPVSVATPTPETALPAMNPAVDAGQSEPAGQSEQAGQAGQAGQAREESTDGVEEEIAPGAGDLPAQPVTIADDDSAVLESALEQAVPAADTSPPPVLSDGQMRMLLTYTGDCWTEVSDGRGRRLFFDLGKDGRTVELSGDAPFNVLLGNINNVSIRVNGVERAVAASERRGRTARMTIAGT